MDAYLRSCMCIKIKEPLTVTLRSFMDTYFRNHWTYAFKFLHGGMLNLARFQCISIHSMFIQGFYFALALK